MKNTLLILITLLLLTGCKSNLNTVSEKEIQVSKKDFEPLTRIPKNNSWNDYLSWFLKKYPIYESKMDELYFEHVGYSPPGRIDSNTRHFFNVYKKEFVYGTDKRAQFYDYDGKREFGEILYILSPIIYSTHQLAVDPNRPYYGVASGVKAIITRKYGPAVVVPISKLRAK